MIFATGQRRNSLRRGGFTLLELIVVMGILSAVIVVTAPRLSRFFQNQVMRDEVRRVYSVLRCAEDMAITSSIPTRFWVDEKTGSFGVVPLQGYRLQESRSATVEKDYTYQLREEFEFQVDREAVMIEDAPSVLYQPDGTVDENSMRYFYIQNKQGEQYAIAITEYGLGYEVLDQNHVQIVNEIQSIRR